MGLRLKTGDMVVWCTPDHRFLSAGEGKNGQDKGVEMRGQDADATLQEKHADKRGQDARATLEERANLKGRGACILHATTLPFRFASLPLCVCASLLCRNNPRRRPADQAVSRLSARPFSQRLPICPCPSHPGMPKCGCSG